MTNGETNGARQTLRVDIIEEPLVSDLRDLLETLERSYNGLLTFENSIDSFVERMRRLEPLLRRTWFLRDLDRPEFLELLPADPRYGLAVTTADRDLSTLILPRDRLVLARAQLSSPGFVEVVGSLNPLEVIRKHLEDRHKRRQDRDYRELAERRRLELDNLILETEAVRGRIALARELGATDDQLAPLINILVYEPSRQLGSFQDRGMIAPPEPDDQEGSN